MRLHIVACVVALSGCPIVVPPIAEQYGDACAQLLTAGELDQAEAACRHSLEYQPKYWNALHNLALIEQQRGDLPAAKKHYIEAVRANQAMKQSFNALGLIAQNEGELKTAAGYFREALRQHPEYAEARLNLGALLLIQKKPREAEMEFRQLVMTAPQLVNGHLGLATALVAQHELEKGAAEAEVATNLNVADARAWVLRGQIAEARGLGEEAKDHYERCLLADDQNLECTRALKRLTSD